MKRIVSSTCFHAQYVPPPSSLYVPKTAGRLYWQGYLRYEYSPWCPTPPFPFTPPVTAEKGTSPSALSPTLALYPQKSTQGRGQMKEDHPEPRMMVLYL